MHIGMRPSDAEAYLIGDMKYIREDLINLNKNEIKKISKFIGFCDFINNKTIDEIGKEDVSRIKSQLRNLNSDVIKEIFSKNKKLEKKIFSAIKKISEREFNAMNESSLSKSKYRHQANINFLDSWKYENTHTEKDLDKMCKEIIENISDLSSRLQKIPIKKLKREHLDQFIYLAKKFEEINAHQIDRYRVDNKISFIESYEKIVEKLIFSEENKLKNSRYESSLNRHTANIEYLIRMSKDIGKTFREFF